MKRWRKRFLSKTRGRVVQLLRRGEASVSDLAARLDVTDNAIRSHLTTLQRDGLVYESGKRPGVRKPETLYALTDEAEELFPRAYHLLLDELLHVLSARLSSEEIDELLVEVGQRLAPGQPTASGEGTLERRVEKALDVLKELGGLAELEESEDGYVIRGYSCPLAAAVEHHPSVCLLAEALLSEIVGVPVHQMCRRNGRPRCVFHIAREQDG